MLITALAISKYDRGGLYCSVFISRVVLPKNARILLYNFNNRYEVIKSVRARGRAAARRWGDFMQAYAWYSIAAANGSETSKKNKEIIAGIMTSAQLAEAQKLSREYWEAYGLGRVK